VPRRTESFDQEKPEQLALPLWDQPTAASPAPRDTGVPDPDLRFTAADPSIAASAGALTGERTGPPASGAPRLSRVIPAFLDFAAVIDRAPHTLRSARVDLGLLVQFLGDRPVDAVTLEDLRRFTLWLRRDRGNDARSLRRKIASVKAFFGYARQAGLRPDNPADRLIYPSPAPHLPEILEDDEAARLVAAVDRPLWRAVILTLLDTGLKRDEVVALHPGDIYIDPALPDRGYLAVRATSESRRLRARTLPLTPRLARVLAEHLATGAGSRLFPISARMINVIVETTARRAGIRKRGTVTPQMLRDTFAVRQVRQRIAEEERRRHQGATEYELALLRARHDLEVCELLGLTAGGPIDPIARYRILAAALPPSLA